MKSHPYPLPLHALADFVHPADVHVLHQARVCAGEVMAGNGYVAIRARRGAWLDADFRPAGPDFVERFEKLPWAMLRAAVERPEWRPLDEARGRIYERTRVGLWLQGRLAPSPVWEVAGRLVRLSLLQLVATLPRCECYTGRESRGDPLLFRFSGGVGMIAHDRRLTIASRRLWAPQYDCLSGERIAPHTGPRPSYNLPGWPPPEPTD